MPHRFRPAFLSARTWAALVAVAICLAACGTTSSLAGVVPTATPTAAPTCATLLPGATTIDLASAGFVYPIAFPSGTVGTTPTQTASGSGLYTVYSFDACSPSTTPGAVTSFFAAQLPALPHGWIGATTFPLDGGLMQTCASGASCWFDPKGGPIYYLSFDGIADSGNDMVTYHAHWAVSPNFPTCNSNFSSSPITGFQSFLPGMTPPAPLPPLTLVVPDDAAGLRGVDLCSAGTAASVSAFLQKELPAEGWTKVASDTRCFYTDECWTGGSSAISWHVDDPTDWHIAWHPST
jgi:hypothetical protein